MFCLKEIRKTNGFGGEGFSLKIEKFEMFVITCDSCIMKVSKTRFLFVVFITIEFLVL
jgi:hypothetical protein